MRPTLGTVSNWLLGKCMYTPAAARDAGKLDVDEHPASNVKGHDIPV